MKDGMMSSHKEMMEEGKYSDLADLREKLGVKMMPWIDNEEEFKEDRLRKHKFDCSRIIIILIL